MLKSFTDIDSYTSEGTNESKLSVLLILLYRELRDTRKQRWLSIIIKVIENSIFVV